MINRTIRQPVVLDCLLYFHYFTNFFWNSFSQWIHYRGFGFRKIPTRQIFIKRKIWESKKWVLTTKWRNYIDKNWAFVKEHVFPPVLFAFFFIIIIEGFHFGHLCLCGCLFWSCFAQGGFTCSIIFNYYQLGIVSSHVIGLFLFILTVFLWFGLENVGFWEGRSRDIHMHSRCLWSGDPHAKDFWANLKSKFK